MRSRRLQHQDRWGSQSDGCYSALLSKARLLLSDPQVPKHPAGKPAGTIRCHIVYGSLYETLATNASCATARRVFRYGEQTGLRSCSSSTCSFRYRDWSRTLRPKSPEGSIETCDRGVRQRLRYFAD